MANLIIRMVGMEIVRREFGCNSCYGDFIVKLVWRLYGVFMEKTRHIKLPVNFHISFTMKFP